MVNVAVPPLPELSLHEFHLCSFRQNRRKDTLEKSTEALEKSLLWIFEKSKNPKILEKSILWIFQDPPVICPNQTASRMHSIEILVEHCRGLIV